MLLVVAALAEEINLAINLSRSREKVDCGSQRLWKGIVGSTPIHFLKTGVGPKRSAARLDEILSETQPKRILVIGYAGALSPDLKLADLILVERVSLLGGEGKCSQPLNQLDIAASFELSRAEELLRLSAGAGVAAHSGLGLTSRFIIGDPAQKELLHRRFHAISVDMETAALARVAHARAIPLSCVRAVSDEAGDEFLAPFSYDPEASSFDRALRVLATGNWRNRYREWREHAGMARKSLEIFLRYCFQTWAEGGGEDSWLR